MEKFNKTLVRDIWGLFICCSSASTVEAQGSAVFGPKRFVRQSARPEVVTRSFKVQDSARLPD